MSLPLIKIETYWNVNEIYDEDGEIVEPLK